MSENNKRLYLEAENTFEEGVEFVFEDGELVISVEDEQAFDSYNHMVTCSATLSRDQMVDLKNWLIAWLR